MSMSWFEISVTVAVHYIEGLTPIENGTLTILLLASVLLLLKYSYVPHNMVELTWT